MREAIGRWSRLLAGLAAGGATALAEICFVAVSGLALVAHLAWPRPAAPAREAVLRGAQRLVALERRRLTGLLGARDLDHTARVDPSRALRYLLLRAPIGLLGGLVLFLLGWGVLVVTTMLLAWGTGFPWSVIEDGGRVTTETIAWATLPGVVLLFINLTGILGVAELERRLARRLLLPTDRERYELRISELATSRADVLDAVNGERRRIERDLHDGVQQSLVALGILLGRARRSRTPETRAELLAQAHLESQRALEELRDVTWRIYPSALDDGGLRAALETIAERSPLPIAIAYTLPDRPHHQVEAVAYFVVSEAVTNTVKHAAASGLTVTVEPAPGNERQAITVEISDDGQGGADADGSGLSGLARRVAALDGSFTVTSPEGGPTTIRAELPCA